MRGRWHRRHPATIALIAGVLAALVLFGQARPLGPGAPADPPHAGVVATHTAAVHAMPWAALRTLRIRTAPPRSGHPSGCLLPGVGLALVLLILIGSTRRRSPLPADGRRAPGVRGPPRPARSTRMA